MTKPEILPTWDLSRLYAGFDDPALERDLAAVVPVARAFREAWRGRAAGLGVAALAEAVAAYEAASVPVLRPYLYASLLFATDAGKPAHVALLRRVQEASALAHKEDLFFPLELDGIPEDAFRAALEDPALAPYRNWLRQGRALKPHRLTEAEEGVLTLKDLAGRSAFVQLYAQLTAGMRFPFAPDGDGEGRDLTGSEILALLKHPDPGCGARPTRPTPWPTSASR